MAGIKFDITADNSGFVSVMSQVQGSIQKTSKILEEVGKNFNIDGIENQMLALQKVIRDNEEVIERSKDRIGKFMADATDALNNNDRGLFDAINKDIETEIQRVKELTAETQEYKEALDVIQSIAGNMHTGETAPMLFNSEEEYKHVMQLREGIEELQSKIASFDGSDAELQGLRTNLSGMKDELRQCELNAASNAQKLGENGKAAAEASQRYYALGSAIDKQRGVVNDLVIKMNELADAKDEAVKSGDTSAIDDATIKYDNMAQSVQEAKMHLINLETEQQSLKGQFDADPTQSIRTQLRQLTQEIAETTLAYRALSDEEKSGATGRDMQAKLESLTSQAGDLRDAMDDVKRAIQSTASDTKNFDALAGGINVVTSSFGAVTGAAAIFGVKQEELLDIQAKLQASLAISNALSVIQNNLQKESALMIGITTLQQKASAIATDLDTAAKGRNIIVTKGATVAQALFNAVAKANPYVLLATAVITVVGALAAFTLGSKKATEAEARQAEEAKKLAEAQKHMHETIGQATGNLVAKYKALQVQWNSLKNDHEKAKWLDENKTKFNELGLKVAGVADAEAVLVKMAPQVVEALKAVAEASAYEDLYKESIQRKAKEWEHRVKSTATGDFYTKVSDRETSVRSQTGIPKEWTAAGLKQGEGYTADFEDRPGNAQRTNYTLTKAGIDKINAYRMKKAQELRASMEKVYTDEVNSYEQAWTKAIEKAEAAKAKIPSFLQGDKGIGQSFTETTTPKGGGSKTDPNQIQRDLNEYHEALEEARIARERYIKDMEFDTEQARIDAMADGQEKTLRQLRLNFRKEDEELRRGYEDLKRSKIEEAKKLFEANPANKDKVFDASKVNTAYTDDETNQYALQRKAIRSQYIQQVSEMNLPHLPESYIKDRIEAIKQEYATTIATIQEEETRLKESQNGTLTESQTQSFVEQYKSAQEQMAEEVKLLEDAEVARNTQRFQNLLEQYKGYDDRRRDIEQKFSEDMAVLNQELQKVQSAGGDTSSIQSTIQERTRVYHEEIQKLQSEIVQTSDFYTKLFGEASEKGYKVLRDFYKQAQETLDNAKVLSDGVEIEIVVKDADGKFIKKAVKVTVDEFQKMKKQVKSIQTELEKRNPFKAFQASWKDMVKAFKEDGDVSGNVKKLNEKGKELTSTFKSWGDSLGSVFGDNFSKSIDEMMQMVDGVMDLGTGIAQIYSGDIVGGITSALSGLSSIIDMFTGWEEKKKEMERQWFIAEIETNAAMRQRNDEYAALRSTISDIIKGEETLNWLIQHGMAKESSVTVWDTMNAQLQSLKTNLSQTEKDVDTLRNKMVTEGRGYYEWGNSLNGGSESWSLNNATDAQLELWYNQDKLNDAARQYYEAWRDSGKSVEELRDKIQEVYGSMQEMVMGTNFDGFLSNTMQALRDARSGVKDLAEFTEDTLSEALMNAFMYKYMAQALEPLYNELAEHMIDGTTDKNYLEQWKSRYDQFFANANAELDKLEEYTGVQLGSGGSKYEQEGTKGGWSAVGQESVDELNGRFAALQMAGERICEGVLTMVTQLASLTAYADSGNITLTEIRNLMITNNAFLEDVLSVSREIYKEFGKKLDKISTNTK